MTPEQVKKILTTICEQWAGKEEKAPGIMIYYGLGGTAAIEATFPSWELEGDILHVHELARGNVSWIACESVHGISV